MFILPRFFSRPLALPLCLFSAAAVTAWADAPLDTVILGRADSEQAHALSCERGEVLSGGLGESARRLLPPGDGGFEGGRLAFTMQVDPDRPTYLTARFWGGDRDANQLVLFCEGKQIGYRHLGDVDVLHIANGSPALPGRFFYVTTPLPESMTKGKTALHFEVRAYGRVNGYGAKFDQYQRPMTEPSHGIYRLYTHTEACFEPPATEVQGKPPTRPPVRGKPGDEVLAAVKEREVKEVAGLLARPLLDQQQLWFLARAYHLEYTPAYHNPAVVEKAVATLDAAYAAYQLNPDTAHNGVAIYNPDWFGLGPAAQALVLLAGPLEPSLTDARRADWARMFVDCRDWHRTHRRQYTNQGMISDTYGLYLPNRAVAVLDPKLALPEEAARRYLHEAVGILPWTGSEKDGAATYPLGHDYFELTDKGLTKELGFVGYYGEVIDWMTAMYQATAPAPGQPGDPELRDRLVKVARARAAFRYPALDDDGNRAMRAETVVGWRDPDHYPGDVTYTQRPTWDASTLGCAAATLDPSLLGGVQQMFADNQFFATLEGQLKTGGLRAAAGLLDLPEQYALVRAQPASAGRLPMSPGQPDFVFSDEEDGVVAVKHGANIFYASLYWRSRYAVNFLARVHDIRPGFERIAVVREDIRFTPGGMTYARPDWMNMGFGNGGLRYPGDLHSASAGETLPIARVPPGVAYRQGDENVYAGRGDFYLLHYGDYLIGMNTTKDRSFDLPSTPDAAALDLTAAIDAGAGAVSGGTPRKVGPRSTVVLYLGAREAAR